MILASYAIYTRFSMVNDLMIGANGSWGHEPRRRIAAGSYELLITAADGRKSVQQVVIK